MVQSINNQGAKPNYSAVKINITKPEVNVANNLENANVYSDNNGYYNAVSIDIDNPTVNTQPKMVYDYPYAESPVTYTMLNPNPVELPEGFSATYYSANVIVPNASKPEKNTNEIINYIKYDAPEEADYEEVIDTKISVPEAEEVPVVLSDDVETNVEEVEDVAQEEVPEVELKRPEIIPSEEIEPDVDIPLVVSNLTSDDLDVQAQQMEEIARIALDNPENAIPYIVTDVFANLMNITSLNTVDMEAPSDEQIEARKKIITNFIIAEQARQEGTEPKLPFEITQKDVEIAEELSSMEQAERNKEYALYTIAILSKIYADEVEKQTGNVVPFTDLPGSSTIVDSLRFNNNAAVKVAAIDALVHISRPEYEDELSTLFTLAQTDNNPQVAAVAKDALAVHN